MEKRDRIVDAKADIMGKNVKNSSGSHGTEHIPTGKGGSTILPDALVGHLLVLGLCVCATVLHAVQPDCSENKQWPLCVFNGLPYAETNWFRTLHSNGFDCCIMCILG